MGLKIDYQKVTNRDEAFTKAKTVITPEYLEKFQVKVDLKVDEAAKTIKASGSGFTLNLSFQEKCCDVDLDLSFLLKPLKSKILEKIQGQIQKNL
jgi:Putative polyhydroxyalkanoic acid system protein (PHA_gran_rgn)